VVSFIRFLATPGLQGGMQLRVTVRGGQTLPADQLAQLQLMIEISRFEG
jgi:hypothetical protein